MKGDARLRLAFGVRGLAFGVDGERRMGEWANVVPTGFEDEDDDEYEDDGTPVGWRSLITFGYSGDGQVPHRKGVERRFLLTGSRLR